MTSKLRWIKNILITFSVLAGLKIVCNSRKSALNLNERKGWEKRVNQFMNDFSQLSDERNSRNESGNSPPSSIQPEDSRTNKVHRHPSASIPRSQPSIFKEHVSDTQTRRQSLLRQQCHRLHLGYMIDDVNLTVLDRNVKLLYSDRYKFILCEIPKCASSSMKKVLLTAEKLVNVTDARKVPSAMAHRVADADLDLRHLRNITEISHKMKSYKRLLIVRNPLYRLLSAYRNKLEVEYPWSIHFANLSRKIHSKFSPNDPGNKLATFSEFLSFVSEDAEKDRHWELYNNLCLPCRMHFDFIAHVETIGEDMKSFMKHANIENVDFPSNYEAYRQTDVKKLEQYMKTVPAEIAEKVFRSYNVDFKLFGFNKPMPD